MDVKPTQSPEYLIRWLSLLELPQVGPIRLRCWYERFSYQELLTLPLSELCQLLQLNAEQRQHLQKNSQKSYSRVLNWLNNPQCDVITWGDVSYPKLLEQIHACPPLLFVQGNAPILSTAQLSIVGSRTPSHTGLDAASYFAQRLVQAGFTVTSGLAIGIDGASHRGVLKARGHTIAVLGSGLQNIYPKTHQRLAGGILDSGGLLVSEYAPDVLPRAVHFPRRNRIISGLSLGTLVIEAGEKSGSLVTARFAVEQNRDVFVLPGVWHSSNSRGGHRLIQQGAKLICDLDDILEEVSVISVPEKQHTLQGVPEGQKTLPTPALLDNVDTTATAIDVIALRSQMSIDVVLTQLIELELQGWVTAVPGGYVKTRRG